MSPNGKIRFNCSEEISQGVTAPAGTAGQASGAIGRTEFGQGFLGVLHVLCTSEETTRPCCGSDRCCAGRGDSATGGARGNVTCPKRGRQGKGSPFLSTTAALLPSLETCPAFLSTITKTAVTPIDALAELAAPFQQDFLSTSS